MKRIIFNVGYAFFAVVFLFFLFRKQPAVEIDTAVLNYFNNELSAELKLTPVSFDDLKDFDKDKVLEALPALRLSCSVISKRYQEWQKACQGLQKTKFSSDKQLREFLIEHFQPFSVNKDDTGLFTGYYEPELNGALVKTKQYTVPLYSLPKDILRIDLGKFNPKYTGDIVFGRQIGSQIIPYYTRKEIETGKMKQSAEPLAWVEHSAELFLLQIQGSGIIRLPSGKRISVGYAGNNGYPFVGIGSIMAKRGLLKPGVYTMSEIKDWLIANPEEAEKLMHENPRYIFFKKLEGIGAVGSMGVRLTAQRSLAVDRAHLPMGSFLWLQTVDPDGNSLNRLMTAQDTGTAIKGPIRGDYFWGTGDKALKEAGRMRSKGTYFILLPKKQAEENKNGQANDK